MVLTFEPISGIIRQYCIMVKGIVVRLASLGSNPKSIAYSLGDIWKYASLCVSLFLSPKWRVIILALATWSFVSQRDMDNYQFSYQLLFCICCYSIDDVMSVEHQLLHLPFLIISSMCHMYICVKWKCCVIFRCQLNLTKSKLICGRIWFQTKSLDKGMSMSLRQKISTYFV